MPNLCIAVVNWEVGEVELAIVGKVFERRST